VLVVTALLLSGCSVMTFMKDYKYQVGDDVGSWDCSSRWVGVLSSFPTGRVEMCEEVE